LPSHPGRANSGPATAVRRPIISRGWGAPAIGEPSHHLRPASRAGRQRPPMKSVPTLRISQPSPPPRRYRLIERLDLCTNQRERKRLGIAGRLPPVLRTGDRQNTLLDEPPQRHLRRDLEQPSPISPSKATTGCTFSRPSLRKERSKHRIPLGRSPGRYFPVSTPIASGWYAISVIPTPCRRWGILAHCRHRCVLVESGHRSHLGPGRHRRGRT
jgi:hypothetical protein